MKIALSLIIISIYNTFCGAIYFYFFGLNGVLIGNILLMLIVLLEFIFKIGIFCETKNEVTTHE